MNNFFNVLSQVADSYVSKSVWGFLSTAIPLVEVDGDDSSLQKDKYGHQLRLKATSPDGAKVFFPVEIHKDSVAAAANNHSKWRIDVYKAERTYSAVALTNSDIIETDEYTKKKESYDLLGVTIDETRNDKGRINIVAYDPNIPIEKQKGSVKLMAIAI